MGSNATSVHREPWNKGKIVGQKAPFKLKDIWALRDRLQMENRVRELALFNLGIAASTPLRWVLINGGPLPASAYLFVARLRRRDML